MSPRQNSRQIIFRSLFIVLMIVLLFMAPWWLILVFSVGGFLAFSRFYEGVGVCFAADMLYGPPPFAPGFPFPFTALSLLFLLLIPFLKKRLIFY